MTDETPSKSVWRSVSRPVMAYFIACVVASGGFVLLLMLEQQLPYPNSNTLSFVAQIWLTSAVLIGMFAALPMGFLIVLLKVLPVHRGFADLCAGGLSALGFASLDPWITAHLQMPLVGLVGAVTGVTYWLAAGCPQNPRRESENTGTT